jgi:hypothetical protein
MKVSSVVMGIGWFLYTASWLFPVDKYGTTLSEGRLPGWEAFLTALFPVGSSASLAIKVWMVSSALTNFIMLSSLGILGTRSDGFKRVQPWLLVLAGILNTGWLILFGSERADLRAGYYLWCVSFFVIAVGCFLKNQRLRKNPVIASQNQIELAAFLGGGNSEGREEMTDRVRFNWNAWITWVALTMVGVELAVLTFGVVLNLAGGVATKIGDFAEVEVTIGVAATLCATMQWIWLRRRMSNALWWIPATVLGWYLAEGLFVAVAPPLEPKNGPSWRLWAIVFCLCLTAPSLPQWFLMRRQFQRSFYWVIARPLASLVGWGFVLLGNLFGVVGGLFHTETVAGLSIYAALFGLGFAPLAGATMVWITAARPAYFSNSTRPAL